MRLRIQTLHPNTTQSLLVTTRSHMPRGLVLNGTRDMFDEVEGDCEDRLDGTNDCDTNEVHYRRRYIRRLREDCVAGGKMTMKREMANSSRPLV